MCLVLYSMDTYNMGFKLLYYTILPPCLIKPLRDVWALCKLGHFMSLLVSYNENKRIQPKCVWTVLKPFVLSLMCIEWHKICHLLVQQTNLSYPSCLPHMYKIPLVFSFNIVDACIANAITFLFMLQKIIWHIIFSHNGPLRFLLCLSYMVWYKVFSLYQ